MILNTRLKIGDGFIVHPGGGFGPPWERPADKVREDVRQGYVSHESAEKLYGIVVDAKTLEINMVAIDKRRLAMKTGD